MRKKQEKIIGLVVLGTSIGALSWIIILGLSLSNLFLIIMPILFTIICVYSVIKLLRKFPKHKLSIYGSAIIWLLIPNFIVINFYFGQIPVTLYNGENTTLSTLFATNKSMFSIWILNLYLAVFAIAGLGLIVADFIKHRKEK